MRLTTSVRRISKPWIPYDKRQFRSGVNAAIREMQQIAVEMTSGTTSAAELRKRGHPFSRRRPQNVPRLPINRQTGGLQSAMRIVRRVNGETEQIYLSVNHPHAIVLRKGGTANMIDRGFMEEYNRRTQGILKKYVLRAFRNK
jgi:hypothetical protein